METATQNWEEQLQEGKLISFNPSMSDYGHFIVSRFRLDGDREIIGHFYTEVDGEEIKYFSTNRRGREIFPPTSDFNEVEKKFQRYAHLLAIQERNKNYEQLLTISNYYSPFKNNNTMQTQQQNPEQKQKKVNQLIFVEYEKAAGDGHFVTIVDSYRNVLGRIHKSFNDQTKKYEYLAYDHAGNFMSKNEKLWQLKNEFVSQRENLLEQAHQRRIASKEKSKETPQNQTEKKTNEVSKEQQPVKIPQPTKAEQRKNELDQQRASKGQTKQRKTEKTKTTPTKTPVQTIEKTETKTNDKTDERDNSGANAKDNDEPNSQQEQREQELEDIRNEQEADKGDDRGDMDV